MWRKIFYLGLITIALSSIVLSQYVNVLRNGGFESDRPALFSSHGVSGATLSWAVDESRSAAYSLKISKQATSEAVYWFSDNMCTYWAPFIFPGKELVMGGYVKTSGVNTNPRSDDQRFYIEFSFYDRQNNLIGGQPVRVYVPQSSSSVDWTRVENDVSVVLPDTAFKLVVRLVGGKDAVGSVWFDDLFLYGKKADGWDWVGSLFNNSFNANEGWFYWWRDFELGTNQYITATVSSEASHSGSKSLKLAEWDWDSDEVVWISDIYELPVKGGGKKYVLSAWVKIDSLIPDSLLNESYAIGFTWTWHRVVVGPNTGWQEVRAEDYKFDLKFMRDQGLTKLDWTQFATVITVPSDDVVGVSVRARFWPLFHGKVFFDDFALAPIVVGVDDKTIADKGLIPTKFELYQNYPNPFNPSTVVEYALPEASHVKIEIFNLVGQKIKTLVDTYLDAGRYRIHWDGTDDNGIKVSSGVYIYRLVAGKNVIARKMMLLK